MLLETKELRVARTLSGVTLSFPPGEQALVAGPAGCGKTTLLKSLAGLVFVDAGAVLWDGEDVRAMAPRRRRELQAQFGMVFQSDALFDSMTVLENVQLPLVKRRVPPREAALKARAVLVSVGLAGAEGAMPEVLSGGMKKRVGIARAIVAEPAVLLADDPFAGLDPATALEVGRVLARAAQGRTLLLAAPEPSAWLVTRRRVELPGVEARAA